MVITTVICDMCERPLETCEKPHPFTGEMTTYVKRYPIHPFANKYANYDNDLCESCASKIDAAVLRTKVNILEGTLHNKHNRKE